MEKGHSAETAGQVLAAAYPDDRQREHAARWLGWIAYRMGDRASFRARSINGWVARRWLGLAGFLRAFPVLCCLGGAMYLGASYLGNAAVLVLVIIASPIIAASLIMLLDRLPGRGRGHGGGPSTRPAGHAPPLRWRWVRLRPLLADAADRGVLRRTGAAYMFADPATAAALAAPYHARDAERARRAADRAREQATLVARPGVRSALIAFLSQTRRDRLGVDFGVGAAVLAFPAGWIDLASPWWKVLGQFQWLGGGMGGMCGLAAWLALALVRKSCIWSLRNVRGLSRRGRLFALVAAAVAAGVLVAAAGTAVAHMVAFTLPATCVAWAGILAVRKVRGKARWLRFAPDAIGAATTAAAFLALTEHNLLTAVPATGLLFPVAVWGSIRIWLAMKGSDRVFSRAGADVTLSLLLGAVLVLLLVWLADLFGMSRPEVAAIRAVLGQVGAVADVPWWAWLAVYLVLAVVSLGIVLRPARMAMIRRWQGRLRIVLVTEVLRRTLTGVHIGLLMIVFIGGGASAILPSAFQHELAVAYTVAFQRQILAGGDADAYKEISQQLTAPGDQGTLSQVVAAIHHDDPPPPGDDDATRSEDELARHVGALQAATLHLTSAQAITRAEAAARARGAGLDAPVRDETDLTSRLTETSDQEQSSDEAEADAHRFGELAAKAVASTINIQGVGSNEVLEVVREYLSGLVEDSDLAGTFAASAQGLRGGTPPAAAALVEPDPAELKQAARQQLEEAYKAAGNPGGLHDDQSYLEQDSVPPLEAAVDMTNQSVQVAGGSCCAVPGEEDEEPPVEGGG